LKKLNNKALNKLKGWVAAARIRTLPLALAVIGLGNYLHAGSEEFSFTVCLLGLLTATLLQVLSNFANDLGDSLHGADHTGRKGPVRMVQQGLISRDEMKNAVILMAVLSLISGTTVLWIAFAGHWIESLPLFFAGLLAIAAAWFYTNGLKPYGYLALGDPAVFIFFGLLAVLGSAWLQVQQFSPFYLLPAFCAGFWSTAVMNLNNMRDTESDSLAGKKTIPMLIGKNGARFYQTFLVLGGGICLLIYAWQMRDEAMLGAIPGFLLMLTTLKPVWTLSKAEKLDGLLKPQALGTFAAVSGMYVTRIIIEILNPENALENLFRT
jgi:1,4-dihydroxy-2-naphthoate octaprenyltransferase